MHLRYFKYEMLHARKRQLLQQYKAKIIRIHSKKNRTIMLDTQMTLYQILKIQKRKEEKIIH
jgi:hypothetical protein